MPDSCATSESDAATPVLLLIHDREVTISDAVTGQVIAHHHIDPTHDYQAPLR